MSMRNTIFTWEQAAIFLIEKGDESEGCDLRYKHFESHFINPLTPVGDQDTISPYNINKISTR